MEDPKKWLEKTCTHSFGSMTEFADYVEANSAEGKAKNCMATIPSSFAGGTFSEALRRGRGIGNAALGEEIARNLEQWDIDSLLTEGCSRWEPSRVGVMPIVPNVIAGVPETMLARNTVHEAARHPLTVVIDRCASASVSTAEMVKYGSCVAALVLTLQRIRPVRLIMTGSMGADNYKCKHEAFVPLVDLGVAPFDPAQVAYALADSLAFRRLCFMYRFIHDDSGTSIPWAWGLYSESDERGARIAHLAQAGEDYIFVNGVRRDDQRLVMQNPRAWVEKQLRVYAPEQFEE